jgi:hypothetical protein
VLAIGDTVGNRDSRRICVDCAEYAMYKTMEEVVKGEKYKEEQK